MLQRPPLSLVLVLALVAAALAASPRPAAGRPLRVMTWNIKGAELSSLEQIAAVIRSERPDLVALQEVDSRTARSGGVDQARRLGELTGMQSVYRAARDTDGGTQGLALLSRFPIRGARKVDLTSSEEQRILLLASVEVGGRRLPVANTHLSYLPETGRVQAREVAARLRRKPRVILFGDLNATPESEVGRTLSRRLGDLSALAGKGPQPTFFTMGPPRRIDYVLLGRAWRRRPAEVRVRPSTASDHHALVGSLGRGR